MWKSLPLQLCIVKKNSKTSKDFQRFVFPGDPSQVVKKIVSSGNAASVFDMCITPKEFAGRLSEFGQYCPVSLAEKGELVDCSTSKSLQFAAEYRSKFSFLSCFAGTNSFTFKELK